ncbi:MAG: toll/interleukin-1 receptor domain-containing protein [Clostridia bacterium]|nr:toll/interleukin-1 receptor domain-containing protein [Clostridia bacterium]
MALFKCKMCGGALEINNNETVATCEYCGTQQTLPKLDDDRRTNMYDRANHFRRNNEFDKAMGIYEQILNEDNMDAEAYWSLVLCRYGIEYVEDPSSHKRIPTVNRAQFTSVFDDDNYKSALQYADGYQRNIYEEEAKAINEIQKGILAISQKEEPFDVFICYKETDNSGRRTPDSVLANDLYHQLTQEGFKVFFSRITLEDKLGSAYEPYIFAALNSAKVMVVLGTKPEYFNAVWVKNEWARYLSLIKNGAKKMLIPAYKDMDPYDLPEEFSHLQAQDMSKLGFMQDLIRGIKKIVSTNENKPTTIKETIISNGNANTEALVKRIFMFLDDGDWKSANEYCEKVLDIDPENVQAYLGKLMADVKVRTKEALKNCKEPFASNPNYLKVVRFGDAKLKEELQNYISIIEERNEAERIERIYQNACNLMTKNQPAMYLKAAELFGSVVDYKDSAIKQSECKEKAESTRKDIIYDEAKTLMQKKDIPSYEEAIVKFESISGWRDSIELAAQCRRSIEEINIKKEQDRLEAIRKAEAEKAEKERAAKERKKKIIITLSSIVAVVIAIVVIVKIANYIEYKPLSDALKEDTISVSKIKSNYTNIQNDKNALKVFEQELELCHKNNNSKKALEILTTLAECDVYFSDWVIGSDGNSDKDLSPYIQGWDTFIDWLYDETIRVGTPIAKEKVIIDNGYDESDDITKMVEVYGFKVAAHTFDDGRVYRMYLYTPSMGWYKLDQSAKYFDGGNNIGYHRKNGGVMVD